MRSKKYKQNTEEYDVSQGKPMGKKCKQGKEKE
jgi:hypothetical protein